jgi:hypothetical protein
MREIEMEWLPVGIKVTARLFEDRNRRLADLLWDALPYNSLQNHALVSGHHLYHLVPLVELIYTAADEKEDRTQSPDGTLFLSQLQHLALKYGPLSEYIPAAPVGRVIPEHIPLLHEAGRACWHAAFRTKEVIEVRVRRRDVAAETYPLRWNRCELPPDVAALVSRIRSETERAWIKPPSEIVRLHDGDINSRAGSYDQYFSTLVFLNGETRPLGYCALNGLVRMCKNDKISLDVLREMTPTFIRTPAEFLGYVGLDTLWHFTQETLRVLPHLQSKEQYVTLVGALALYANVLNTWNLQYFPWRHGVEYPSREQPTSATA